METGSLLDLRLSHAYRDHLGVTEAEACPCESEGMAAVAAEPELRMIVSNMRLFPRNSRYTILGEVGEDRTRVGEALYC